MKFLKCPDCGKIGLYVNNKIIPQYNVLGKFEGYIVRCKNCGNNFKV